MAFHAATLPHMPRRILPVLLASACLAAAAPVAGAQEPAASDPLLPAPGRCTGDRNVDAHHRTQRLAMHCLIRGIRRAAGVSTVRSSVALRHAAIYKARRIAECKRFTHNPCGDALAVPFHRAHVTDHGTWFIGEDLAWQPFRRATARRVAAAWLASPKHREVLLDPRFSHLGVRRRRLELEGKPRGAVLWVAHLGTPGGGV